MSLSASHNYYYNEFKSTDDLFIKNLQTNEDIISLSHEEMLKDYDMFWLMLEENAPFVLTATNNRGISTKGINENYRKMIQKDTSSQGFADIIINCANEFNSLGHLRVVTKEELDRYQQILNSSHVMMNTIMNSRSQSLYNTIDLSMDRIRKDTSINDSDNSKTTYGFKCIDESINAYISEESNIAYIKFSDFSSEKGKTSRLINFYKRIEDFDNIIIDVRDNTGGPPNIWRDYVVSLLATEDIQFDSYTLFNMGQNSSLYYTSWNPKLYEETITKEDWIYNTPYFKGTFKQNARPDDVIVKFAGKIKKSNMSIEYDGNIWVLVNENSFSAADSFAYFCNKTNFATTVGTRTKGNGITAITESQCLYALPNSGIIIKYFPFMGFNLDGSSNIEGGDIPQIFTYDDALVVCFKKIEANKQ